MKITFLENRMIYKGVSGTKPSVEAPAAATVVAPVAPAAAPAPATTPAAAKTDAGVKTEISDAALTDSNAQELADQARAEGLESASKARQDLITNLNLTVEAKKTLYLVLAGSLNGNTVDLSNSSTFEGSKTAAVTVLKRVFTTSKWTTDTTLEEIVKTGNNAPQIAQTFVDEVFTQLKAQYDSDINLQNSVSDRVNKEGKAAQYGMDVFYDSNTDKITAKFNSSVVPDASGALDKMSDQEIAAGVLELESGRGKMVLTILKFLGLIDPAKLVGSERNKTLNEIVTGEEYGATLLCGVFGFSFGKKELARAIEVIPEGTTKEGIKQIVGNLSKKAEELTANTNERMSLKDLAALIGTADNEAAAKPFEKAAMVDDVDLVVFADRPLMVKIPRGLSVKLVNASGDKLTTVYDTKKSAEMTLPVSGEITAVEDNYIISIAPKTVIGKGSYFGKGTSIWKGPVVASAEASSAASSDETTSSAADVAPTSGTVAQTDAATGDAKK